MACSETLNPTVETCTSTSDDDNLENEGNMFGVGTSFEKSFQALVNGKLSFFMKLSIPFTTCEDLFIWWHNHER
jgi:hypothetical protein